MKINKNKLEKYTRAAFREAQEDDKRNYMLSMNEPGRQTKEQRELLERAYVDKLWELKVSGFRIIPSPCGKDLPCGVLDLSPGGVYCLSLSKNSDAHKDVVQ